MTTWFELTQCRYHPFWGVVQADEYLDEAIATKLETRGQASGPVLLATELAEAIRTVSEKSMFHRGFAWLFNHNAYAENLIFLNALYSSRQSWPEYWAGQQIKLEKLLNQPRYIHVRSNINSFDLSVKNRLSWFLQRWRRMKTSVVSTCNNATGYFYIPLQEEPLPPQAGPAQSTELQHSSISIQENSASSSESDYENPLSINNNSLCFKVTRDSKRWLQELELKKSLHEWVNWQEVKHAFNMMVKLHHPDRGGDAQKFRCIYDAYLHLTNWWKKCAESDQELSKDDLNAILKALNEEHQQLFQEMQSLKNDFTQIINTLKTHQKLLDDMKQQLAQLNQEISSLNDTDEKSQPTAESRYNSLEGQNQWTASKIKQNEETLRILERKIVTLRQQPQASSPQKTTHSWTPAFYPHQAATSSGRRWENKIGNEKKKIPREQSNHSLLMMFEQLSSIIISTGTAPAEILPFDFFRNR